MDGPSGEHDLPEGGAAAPVHSPPPPSTASSADTAPGGEAWAVAMPTAGANDDGSGGETLATTVGGGVLTLGVLMVIWAALTSGSEPIVELETFPSIGETFSQFGREFRGTTAIENVVATLLRLAGAVIVGGGLGAVLGAVMGAVPKLRGFLRPIAQFFQWVSPALLYPLVILWFGIGDRPIVFVSGAVVFSAIAWHTSTAIADKKSDPETNLPYRLVLALRSVMPVAWALVLIGELIGAREGIGAVVFAARPFFRTDVMVANILLTALIALAIDGVLRLIQYAVRN